MRKALIATVSAVALVVVGFSATAAAQDEPGTIVDIASSDEQFSTLVTAVDAAGLVETLSGEGPFTVFAPTNAAFDALPEGTLDSLLEDPEGALTEILLLHVVEGAVLSDAAIEAAGGTIETLGGPVSVELDGDNLVVGGATVTTADIEASNGVIHVIDSVIVEPASAEEPADDAAPAPAPTDDTAAAPADDTAAAPAPTRVDTGTGGLAAESQTSGVLLALVAMAAVAGLGTSAYALARRRN